jgi:subtilisin family serine protease
VINVSLVGPANAVLERVVARMVARGHLIVAAVGNDGPAAPPLYPAAYDGVIAVTGVDRRGRVLLEAGRGPFIDFAALGADLEAATLTSARAPVRGTSFAAPAVAATLALRTAKLDRAEAEAAVASLAAAAVDLGAKGRDPVYGYGWVKVPSLSSTDGAHEVMSHAPATGNL